MKSPPRGQNPWDTANFTYKDLQIACITRGIDFDTMIHGDWHKLAQFYKENYFVNPKQELIYEFEAWADEVLAKTIPDPQDPLRLYRLTYSGGTGESFTPSKSLKKAGVKAVKKPKKLRRVKDEAQGIFKGTKKHLTYEMTAKGYSLEKVIRKVTEVFPEAVPKSIGIWFKKAKANMPAEPIEEPKVEVRKKKKKKKVRE